MRTKITFADFVADDGTLALAVDVQIAVGAPANAEDAGRTDAVVAVALETGQTFTLVHVEHFVESASRVRTAIGRLFARFFSCQKHRRIYNNKNV